MKAKLYKIVIAAQFDEEIDNEVLADRVMRALQVPGIPSGRAQVVSVPLDPLSLQPIPAGAPVPRNMLN